MRISRPSTKPLVEAQMISLADIAFLVIFFFLLTSTVIKDKLKVKLPELPKTAKTEASNVVLLDANHVIFLNGESVANADSLEGQIKSLLRGKTKPEECEVRLRCEKTLTFKDYSAVYDAISNAGGVIAIMHEVRK